MIDHDDAWAMLPEAATDTLSDEAALQLHAHLEGCARCSAELASLRAVAAQLMYATPLEPVSADAHARVKARLTARAAADAAGHVAKIAGEKSVTISSRARHRSRAGLFAGAASIALGASLVALAWTVRDRAALRSRLESRELQAVAERRASSSRLDSLERLVATVTAQSVTTIHLTAAGTRPTDAAVYWNRQARVLTLVAHDLPRTGAGRAFQLWVLTETAPVSAGMVFPDNRGNAATYVDGLVVETAVRGFALSEEPAGGSPQPTHPFLSGRVATAGSRE